MKQGGEAGRRRFTDARERRVGGGGGGGERDTRAVPPPLTVISGLFACSSPPSRPSFPPFFFLFFPSFFLPRGVCTVPLRLAAHFCASLCYKHSERTHLYPATCERTCSLPLSAGGEGSWGGGQQGGRATDVRAHVYLATLSWGGGQLGGRAAGGEGS
jgi:hypothetical protein